MKRTAMIFIFWIGFSAKAETNTLFDTTTTTATSTTPAIASNTSYSSYNPSSLAVLPASAATPAQIAECQRNFGLQFCEKALQDLNGQLPSVPGGPGRGLEAMFGDCLKTYQNPKICEAMFPQFASKKENKNNQMLMMMLMMMFMKEDPTPPISITLPTPSPEPQITQRDDKSS